MGQAKQRPREPAGAESQKYDHRDVGGNGPPSEARQGNRYPVKQYTEVKNTEPNPASESPVRDLAVGNPKSQRDERNEGREQQMEWRKRADC
jgi:hypothetical protein